MKACFVAVAVLATIAIASAVDRECVQRKLRGLRMHWPNPTSCTSFYRCTNKNVKRELVCPTAKEYNPKTGRCVSTSRNVCKLSLKSALNETTSPCANELSGTYVADDKSCRGFNICNNKLAYPQSCDAGSYFNTSAAACVPDTKLTCWENLCVSRDNGVYVANDNDCYNFYICSNQEPVLQECPKGSYFDNVTLICRPGVCPSDVTTETTTLPTTEITTPCPDETTTPEITTPCPDKTTTPKVTTPCTKTTTTPKVTTPCVKETTTPKVTTPCTKTTTTPKVTTPCTKTTTTPKVTTPCVKETTTPKVTTPCTKTTTTPKLTTPCEEETTTPAVTTPCEDEPTTPAVTTPCEEETTTPKVTTPFEVETTTPAVTTPCEEETTTPAVTTPCEEETTTPAVTTPCEEETTTPAVTTPCEEETTTPKVTTPFEVETTTPAVTTPCEEETTTPAVTTPCEDEPTTPAVTTPCEEETTTPAVTTPCEEETTTPKVTTPFEVETTTPAVTTPCEEETTTPAVTTPCEEETTTPAVTTPCEEETTTPAVTTPCEEETTTPAVTTPCEEETTTPAVTTPFEVETTTCDEGDCAKTNCDQSKCLNAADNTIFGALNGMSMYCVCRNQQAVCQECVGDSVFFPEFKICLDTTTPPPTTKSFTTQETVPVAESTTPCSDDTTTPKPSTPCAGTPKPVTCVGGLEEGDFAPNLENCMLFYICFDGQLIDGSCGAGSYFDAQKMNCITDTDGKCPQCTAGQSATVRRKRSVITAPSDTEPCCPGGYKNGEMIPHPDDCSKMLVCCNGEMREESCGTGYYFNQKTSKCEPDTGNVCKPSSSICSAGDVMQNPANCSSYFTCCTGAFVEKFCDVDYYFSKVTMQCEPDTEHVCWPDNTCTCPGGYRQDDILPSADCDKYYICNDGDFVLESCGINNYFNEKTKTCELDTKHECWKNYCADQPNGALVANPEQCNAFYICQKGESTEGVCSTGEWFDPNEASCQPDVNAVCYNPCASEDKITVLPNPDCAKYYWCNGNETLVGTCDVGGFDATIGGCNPKKSCSANQCDGKPNYYTYADPDNANNFYVCMNGVPVMKECGPGTQYNGEVCAHVSDADCDDAPCKSSGYVPPFATLNATEDNAFCMCRDGFATKQYCSPEYTFDAEIGACFSNAPCDPMVCKYSADYFPFENRNDTNSFCMCVDSTAVIVQCPSGSFNPYISSCTDVEISDRCDQAVCRDQSNYYTYPDNTNSVDGFCECQTKVGVFVDCPVDSAYDSTFGICILTNINCDSSKCKGEPDYTKLPALTTTDGYCECVNGTATYYNYPSVCDAIECVGVADYTTFPADNTTSGFCMCIDNQAQYRNCDAGGEFNSVSGMCMMPLKTCDVSMCVGQPDNTKQPAWSSISGYCLCSGGTVTYEDCANGKVFDVNTQACVPDNRPIEDLCIISYCQDSANAGAKYPSIGNNNGYCQCAASGPVFELCPDGDIFNYISLTCTISSASQCNIALCASATPDNTFSTPAKNSNTSFCFCSGPNTVMILSCPAGKFYNNEQQMCVGAVTEGCSCPNGLQSGDITPDTTNCSQYYVCSAGRMHQKSCPTGEYFNVDCNNCIEDDGTCVLTSASSCLGAYSEGERVQHPLNSRMYYVCENKMLHERECDRGRIFNKLINQCMIQRATGGHYLRKRSVDVDEFVCINDEKRSVPSNCSQYEICINEAWKRRTCTQFRYYNPEQQKCLEPRDDTICAYAKVSMLPECTTALEQRVLGGRTCQQYFRCQKGKWRLKSCGKTQYFEERLAACLPHGMGDAFKCNLLASATKETAIASTLSAPQCQHLSVRAYDKNCAMYLMCLENVWWYQYCPLGMYFNRSLNYCTPDPENYCLQVLKTPSIVNDEDYIVKEPCSPEGVLRPSALACNRYYICIDDQWQHQQCANTEFYDVQHNKCSPDTDGICSQLQMDCLPREKRVFPLNCTAYEECSSTGQWYRSDCTQGEIFDELLQRCVPNDGICSARGLKRVCSNARETRPVPVNCTQFYFCAKDDWALGSCLRGHMFSPKQAKCIPHSMADKCQPLREEDAQDINIHVANERNFCENQLDGTVVAHPSDCTRYYICIQNDLSHELQCTAGSFYDSSLGYCRPNDGSCRLELTGVCANASDGSSVAHPTDCQAYYSCSTITGQQLEHCPLGQYYHMHTRQCRVDHGECNGSNNNLDPDAKCQNVSHGTLVAHELYCNIYYACVRGLAIPVECPDNYKFNALLGKCIYDADNRCQDGQLVDGNQTNSCGNLTDGSYISDRKDCTRYYICSAGQAQPKKCPPSTYFDSHQLLCVPDDGSCPYVDDNEPNETPVPPDPIVCEGKHGNLMPDPLNCNNFYVCINSKLRHERCYPQHFFNATSNQCQQKLANSNQTVASSDEDMPLKPQRQQCTDEPMTVDRLCQEYGDGATIADQGDCRFYMTCQEEGENPISQRCRNGESYDSLLGFCRQNDGTCLLENGQRAGDCSDHHGQLVRDTNNCRMYFICVNGQKIAQTCQDHEYFSKSLSKCLDDTLNICNPEQQSEELTKQSCVGLSESVLYPYIYDNCRSYFQCIKGVARIHQCADDLYFDPNAIKCVRNLTECVMPQQTMQRTTAIKKQTFEQLCGDRSLDRVYANVENHCRSFYTCGRNGDVIHELCPLGMAFDQTATNCVTENKVICV